MNTEKFFTMEDGQLYQEITGEFKTPCICPFRGPLVVPKQNKFTGQVEMDVQQPGCNIQCHFFRYSEKENTVLLTCSKAHFELNPGKLNLTTL